jgi:hypothetical protein
MKYIKNMSCIRCQFFVELKLDYTLDKEYDFSTRVKIRKSYRKDTSYHPIKMCGCYKGIWNSEKCNIETSAKDNPILIKRNLDECYYIDYKKSRTLKVSEQLQEREYKRRESQKQWFVTVLALLSTVLVGFMAVVFNSFLDNASIFWKAMVLIAFVVFGYSIFNVLKVKLWDNRV